MNNIKNIIWIVGITLICIAVLSTSACGGGQTSQSAGVTTVTADPPTATSVPEPTTLQATSRPVTTLDPSPTPTEPVIATPTNIPVPTATNTPVPTPTPKPTPTATPTVSIPTQTTVYDQFGFTLTVDDNVNITSAGWTETEPSKDQGILSFGYKGVTVLVIWIPSGGTTPAAFLADNFALLQTTQSDVTFIAISEGDVVVSEVDGKYAGFGATDAGGDSVNGGLIGAWICSDTDTAFGLTTTGADATILQIRFQRLLNSFGCEG